MDNLSILISILLIIVVLLIFFPIHRHTHTVHKIHPTIVRPSYWITPTGPSWYPPRHRYNYQYSSGPSYRNYYRDLNNLYKKNNDVKRQRKYRNNLNIRSQTPPHPPPPSSNSKSNTSKNIVKVSKISNKKNVESFSYSLI
jgi:hypothetical protein